jgi:hypothetical protein
LIALGRSGMNSINSAPSNTASWTTSSPAGSVSPYPRVARHEHRPRRAPRGWRLASACPEGPRNRTTIAAYRNSTPAAVVVSGFANATSGPPLPLHVTAGPQAKPFLQDCELLQAP